MKFKHTVFPKIVFAKIKFGFIKCRNFEYLVATNFNFLPNKLNFCYGNYTREETIQGRKLFVEITYNSTFFVRRKNYIHESFFRKYFQLIVRGARADSSSLWETRNKLGWERQEI